MPLGTTVAVIGAGNTAIDAVTQAKRLGAEKVMLVYRRNEKDASAYDYEMELARKDGVEFVSNHADRHHGGRRQSRLTGLRCKRPTVAEIEIPATWSSRPSAKQKMASFFTDVAGVDADEKGRVVVNDKMQTSDPKIFSGGDCANGGKEAVDASQMGKLAAQGIH